MDDGSPGGDPVQMQEAAAEEQEMLLYQEEAQRRWSEEDGDAVDAKHSYQNDSSAVGATAATAAAGAGAAAAAPVGSGGRWRRGDEASRSAALRRCNSQQMARISATAAAVEAAAAAVAAIPAVGGALFAVKRKLYGTRMYDACSMSRRFGARDNEQVALFIFVTAYSTCTLFFRARNS